MKFSFMQNMAISHKCKFEKRYQKKKIPLQYDSINMKFKNGQTKHDGGTYI